MKEKINLGIIGLGMVFRFGYLPWLKSYLRQPWVELKAVSDLKEELGVKYSRKFKCDYYKGSFDLLKSGIDAVIINSPNWTHEELVVEAANSKLHILCEKPMSPTVEACDRMISACRKSGVLLLISQMRRFNPGFQKIRELVMKEELGNLVELNVNWPFFIPEIDKSPYKEVLSWIERYLHINLAERYGSWRLKDARSGGGNFLDHGPHIIDFFRWIAGDITHVTGSSNVLVKGRNEDYTKCVLKFKSGATGYITTTIYDFKYGLIGKAYGFIRGTRGRVDFTLPNPVKFKPIRYLKIYREPDSNLKKVLTLATLKRLGGKRTRLQKKYVFKDQLDYFLTTILGKRRPHPVFGDEDFAAKGEDGRYAIKIVELVYKAARSEDPRWLPVG